MSTAAGARRPRRWAPAALLALGFIPVVIGTIRLVQVLGGPAGIEPDPRFDALPAPVALHVLASVPYVVLGALQFSARLRRRRWHRRAGRALVPLGLVVAGSALWMTLAYDAKPGTGATLFVVRLLVAVGMGAALLLGLAAVRRGDITAHRAWMTRAYALALGAGTQAFTVGFGEAAFGSGVLAHDLQMTAGWGLNLAVAELVVRRGRRARRPVSRPAPEPVRTGRRARSRTPARPARSWPPG